MSAFAGLFRLIETEVDQGRRVALCTVVSAQGSTPQVPGAAMVLREDMTTAGTLGGGCVEAEVRRLAFELLRANRADVLKFQLDHDYGWDDGLICGGTMQVAVALFRSAEEARPVVEAAEALERNASVMVPLRVEREGRSEEYRLHVEAPAKLIIAGGGHVGAELARLAVGLDFRVTVIDDRTEFANAERLPPPIQPIEGDIEKTLREQELDAKTFVVIVTRGHKHDEQALHAVIESDAGYIGMIGSRRKVKVIFDDLAAHGVARERLSRVHAPVGLPIGAVTVPEIAVSILAQLIEVRRKETPTHVEGPFEVPEGGPAS